MPENNMKDMEVSELADLLDVTKLVVSTIEMDKVLESILESAMRLTNTSAGSIALYSNETHELELHAYKGFSQDFIGNARWLVRPGGLTDKILHSSKPTVITDTTNKKFFTNPLAIKEGIKSLICVPLTVEKKIIGVLYVDDFKPRNYSKAELKLLSILSTYAAMSIDHAKLLDKTRKLACTDGLTGLYNHRHFQDTLSKELSRAERYEEPLSLMLADIDDFKLLNDQFGHTFGDTVLRRLAEILMAATRESDTAARYGGEEFAIILPKVNSSQAAAMARRLMEEIDKNMASLMRGKLPLTVSIGISSFPDDSTKPLELIKKADKALYEAKRLGKDRVVLYRETRG